MRSFFLIWFVIVLVMLAVICYIVQSFEAFIVGGCVYAFLAFIFWFILERKYNGVQTSR